MPPTWTVRQAQSLKLLSSTFVAASLSLSPRPVELPLEVMPHRLESISSKVDTKPWNVPFQEFNHGLVLSAAPLLDNQMVEVRPFG